MPQEFDGGSFIRKDIGCCESLAGSVVAMCGWLLSLAQKLMVHLDNLSVFSMSREMTRLKIASIDYTDLDVLIVSFRII